jgi:hypothetical protein
MDQVRPNTIRCKFFDDDFAKTWESFKKSGGVIGAILKSKGKHTEEELQDAKKKMRKPRKDKGNKRERKNNS